MLSGENFNLDPARDSDLKIYVTAKAKKELKGVNGYLSDETVLDWTRHFYSENQEEIDKEMKELGTLKSAAKKRKTQPL